MRASRTQVSCLALMMAGALATPALAQQQLYPAPPSHYSVDERGVDLVSGSYVLSTTDVVIGQPGEGGLAYGRTYVGPGWRDNLTGTIETLSNGDLVVSVGGMSEVFTSSLTPRQNNGATLETDGSGGHIYRTRDGTAYTFLPPTGFYSSPVNQTGGLLGGVVFPNNERWTYTYGTVIVPTGNPSEPFVPAGRLESVTSNAGYRLTIEYSQNNPSNLASLPSYYRILRVTGSNLAANTTVTWPSATYGTTTNQQTVTDELGRITRYTFSGNRVTAIRRPTSTSADHVTIGYDTNGRVNAVSEGGSTFTYVFSSGSALRTNPGTPGSTVEATSSGGRVVAYRDELSRTTNFTYDTNGRLERIRQPEGNRVDYSYDTRGNVTAIVATNKDASDTITASATFPTTCTTANRLICNQPETTTDALGHVTNYVYSTAHGGVESVTLPAPATGAVRPQTRYTYGTRHAWTWNGSAYVQNPQGIVKPTQIAACQTLASCTGLADETRTTFDYGAGSAANNVLPRSVTSGAATGGPTSTTALTYTWAGDVETVDGPLSGTADTTRYRYDAGRQLVGVVGPDPDGGGALLHRAVKMTYNNDGQVTVMEQGTVTSQSDSAWAAFAGLRRTQTTYDTMGRPTHERLISGSTTYALTQMNYDARYRPDCVTTRMNPSTFASPPTSACTAATVGTFGPDRIAKYGYDTASQLTSLTRGFGRPEAITEALTYTENGLVETATNGRSYRTTFIYDGFDRLYETRYPLPTTVNASSTTDIERYDYDDMGNVLTWRQRDGASFTLAYDRLGRLTTRDAPGTTPDITYAYDNLGRVTSASQTGATLSWTYDALGRVLTQVQPQGTVTRQYDAAGRRTRLTWPGGNPYATYQYNTVGDLTGVCVNTTSCAAGSLALYGYDNLGRRTTTTQGSGSVSTRSYDPAGRLTSLDHNLPGTANDLTFTYSYNPAFQITSRTTSNNLYIFDESDGSLATPANGVDRYTTVGGASTSYDTRGNFLSGGVARTYSYNANNELTGITGGTASTLAYDPAGRLIRQTGTQDSAYLFDGNQVIAAFNGATGSLTQRFVPSDWIDERAGVLQGTTVTSPNWASIDERGTVLNTHTASAMTGINTYDAYGQPGPGNIGRFGYTGQMWLPDAQAWHYKARAYHPGIGRFLQTDPIGYGDGLNLYAYVGGDPVNWVDPTGLLWRRTNYYFCPDDTGDGDTGSGPVPEGCRYRYSSDWEYVGSGGGFLSRIWGRWFGGTAARQQAAANLNPLTRDCSTARRMSNRDDVRMAANAAWQASNPGHGLQGRIEIGFWASFDQAGGADFRFVPAIGPDFIDPGSVPSRSYSYRIFFHTHPNLSSESRLSGDDLLTFNRWVRQGHTNIAIAAISEDGLDIACR